VVIDPMGNLPGARREGRAVADQLTAAGWRVTTLAGLEATRLAILDGLGDSDLLHVAAHGEVGTAPLDAWLVATDGRVTVTDLLALPAVPRTVVLAGCDTAVPAGGASSTIGLAQAFLAKGADAVVATTRPVDDAVTAVVAPSLYRHGLTTDAPSALRAAVLEGLSAGLPGAQLAALRVLTP
jgi:CHAT domain-containing protein